MLGKDTIDQVVVNKHIKIRGNDVIIKSVVLENYFFKKYDKPPIKLDSIDQERISWVCLEKKINLKT